MLLGAKIFSLGKKKIKAQNKMMLWNVELDVLKKVYFPLQIMLLKRQPKYPALKKRIK